MDCGAEGSSGIRSRQAVNRMSYTVSFAVCRSRPLGFLSAISQKFHTPSGIAGSAKTRPDHRVRVDSGTQPTERPGIGIAVSPAVQHGGSAQMILVVVLYLQLILFTVSQSRVQGERWPCRRLRVL